MPQPRLPSVPPARALHDAPAAARGLPRDEALRLVGTSGPSTGELTRAARQIRDARWGRTATFSPKVFLPVTNLCRNRCDYCSFRRSPGDDGEWTMSPDEIERALAQGAAHGCSEALLCLGDKPESAFGAYRRTLATYGHQDTVDYLVWTCEQALARGLLPHTNAGILSREDMARLRPLNASLGLMLETASERLCEPGMPHHRAPDKRPRRRLAMLREAGELRIPFTTGILIGIGETEAERVEALLAVGELHREHGHIQEVIVQSFRARPGIPMAQSPEPSDEELCRAIALARLVLDPEISVQAPPNLSPTSTRALLDAGINDFGGISPVTPDYINHLHPWPHIAALRGACEEAGFALLPRLPVYPPFVRARDFVDPGLRPSIDRAAVRLAEASL